MPPPPEKVATTTELMVVDDTEDRRKKQKCNSGEDRTKTEEETKNAERTKAEEERSAEERRDDERTKRKVDLEAYQVERAKVREEGNKWIKDAPQDSKSAATKAIGSARGIGTYGIRRNFAEGELLKGIWLIKNVQEDYDPSLHWPAFKAGLLREHVYARNHTHAQKCLAEQIRLAL